MSTIVLRPLEPAAYDAWRVAAVESYAAEKVTAGNWTREESLAKAEQAFARLLPDGVGTPGHHLYALWSTSLDRAIGMVWFQLRPGAIAFIYDIAIDPDLRGKGLGKPAMAATEAEMKRLGATSSSLHVFGHNTAARRLYETCGYVITNIDMSKAL